MLIYNYMYYKFLLLSSLYAEEVMCSYSYAFAYILQYFTFLLVF